MKEERKEEKKNINNSGKACKNCRGGFHCLNEKSPCYMYYCGEYPGTGPGKRD